MLLSLPAGVSDFTARRAELATLSELLLDTGNGVAPMAIVTGEPGIGKTALAVNWAWRQAGSFPDGVLYRDLRGWGPDEPASPEEVITDWLSQLGMDPGTMPKDLASRSSALRSALAGRRVLLLLDNARNEEQVRPLLPGTPLCSVLITSRATLSGLAVHHGAKVVELDLLTGEESVRLLRVLIGPRVDQSPETAGRLAELCGDLPLALRVVAENARVRDKTPLAALVAELVDEQDRLDELDMPDQRSTPRGVFSWSYRQLTVDAAAVFRAIGSFPGRTYDSNVIAALAGLSPRAAGRQLHALARAHLVREAMGGRFEMHDLIRLYARELSRQEDEQVVRAAYRRLFDYFLHTARRADELVMPHRYRIPLPSAPAAPPPFNDYDGALAWLYAECANTVALCKLDHPDLDAARWRLAFLFRGFFFLTKRNHEWIESHEYAVAAAIRLGDRGAEAMTRSNLGVALHERGDDDGALVQYEIANRLFTEVDDPHGISNTLAQRAVVHRHRGEFEPAFRLSAEALAFYRRAGSLRNAAITLRTIARIELESGRPADAEQHLAESLRLCHQLGMSMDTARAYNALGEALLLLGRYDDAVRAHSSAIEVSKGCGSRFEEALAFHGLGKVASAIGDRAAAESHLQEAVDVLSELGSPQAASARADLAALREGEEGGQSSG